MTDVELTRALERGEVANHDFRHASHLHVAWVYLTESSSTNEAKHRNSVGVAFDLLAIGPQSMVTKMHYRKENVIPFHSHPNEQTGYILSGRICVLTRDSRHELGPDDTYAIPANVEHSIEIIEDAEEVQVFTPPREDFR